jgi:hypothetical protein
LAYNLIGFPLAAETEKTLGLIALPRGSSIPDGHTKNQLSIRWPVKPVFFSLLYFYSEIPS